MPAWPVSIARPSVTSRWWPVMTRRCGPSCGGSRGGGRGGGIAARISCCSMRAGQINRKRTQRVWREEGLRVPRKRRKRQRLGESTVPADRLRAERPDHVWAIDFQWDQTADGHNLKLLHVVDEFTREALAIECHRRIDADQTVDRPRPPRRRARDRARRSCAATTGRR